MITVGRGASGRRASRTDSAAAGGAVEKVDAGTLVLKERSGEILTLLVFADNFSVSEIVAIEALLVPGAKVQVTAQLRDGRPTALRALAGRNRVWPPM